jgi:hypothetical protein
MLLCSSPNYLILFFPAKTWSLRSWWRGFDNCRKWSTLADKFWEVHILFKEEGVLMYLLYSIYVVACIRFLFPLYLCFHLHACRWDFLKQDPSIARCKPISFYFVFSCELNILFYQKQQGAGFLNNISLNRIKSRMSYKKGFAIPFFLRKRYAHYISEVGKSNCLLY